MDHTIHMEFNELHLSLSEAISYLTHTHTVFPILVSLFHLQMATTSKEGSRRVNYPILTQVRITEEEHTSLIFNATISISILTHIVILPFPINREVVTINNNAGPPRGLAIGMRTI